MKAALAVIALLASLAACQPLTPKSDDKCKDAPVTSQECWGTPPAPGTGLAAANARGPLVPGSHRVLVIIDAFSLDRRNQHFQGIHIPVHILTIGRSGKSIAIDVETGNPFAHRDNITTPDAIAYDLGPGVTHLQVSIASLRKSGEALTLDITLDGKPYPIDKREVSNPAELNAKTRMLSITAEVEIAI